MSARPASATAPIAASAVDKTTVPKLQMDLVLAPGSWTPVYSVKAK